MHKMTILGRLGAHFEARQTSTGKVMATSTIASTTKFNGEEKTTWIKLVAFGPLADVLIKYSDKGQMLFVEGTPQAEAWTDKSGEVKSKLSVIVNEFTFCGGSPRQEQAPAQTATESEDW